MVPQEKGFSISKDGDHKHSHRHTHHHHSSHKHSSSQNAHVPTVTVHAHGQTYNSGQQYSVARPSHKYSSSAHVLGAPPVQVMQQSYCENAQLIQGTSLTMRRRPAASADAHAAHSPS